MGKEAKTKRWVRLSKKPMSYGNALSRGARAADNTISAQFKVVPTKKSITPRGSDPYFNLQQHKFREYKIRQKKKIKTPSRFIERKGSPRIDTVGERQDLTLSKMIKRKRWRF